jgi:hypothetical protein
MLAAAAAVAGVLAGCGGGGDAAEEPQTPAPAVPAAPPTAMGVAAAEGAGDALAALGTTQPVDPDDVASTLGAYEAFGLPHDLFRPQVLPAEPSAEEQAASGETVPASVAAGVVPAAVPIAPGTSSVVVPLAGAGASATPGAVTTPPAGAASGGSAGGQRSNLTAYFRIRGEPVTAREGDTVPPDRQELMVSRIREGGVTITLIRGLLPNGSDTLDLRIGETAKLIDTQNGQGYTITLSDVREAQTP